MATLGQECQTSKRTIDRAGTTVRDWYLALLEGEADIDDIPNDVRRGLLLMSTYRKTFAPTLKNVTVGVRQFVQRESGKLLVSQRLKRLPTILDKLARHPTMKLTQMPRYRWLPRHLARRGYRDHWRSAPNAEELVADPTDLRLHHWPEGHRLQGHSRRR